MLNYIIRRILIMPLTLFGITVMVFLIARFAPGRPGQMQQADATMDAEQQQALQEWYDKRYGLDLPLYQQYIRWWTSMFTRDVQATAWFEKQQQLRPIFTYRTPPKQYYVRGEDDRWYTANIDKFQDEFFYVDDPDFREQISEDALAEYHYPPEAGYATPTHLIADAELTAIENLSGDVEAERIGRAEDLEHINLQLQAPAWTDQGQQLYVNPDDPSMPIFEENGEWFKVEPSTPLENTSVYAASDTATLAPILGEQFEELPQEKEGYSLPRYAIVFGLPQPYENTFERTNLERLTIPTEVSSPSGIWVRRPGSEQLAMLWEQAEPLPILLVPGEDEEWSRLIGQTRAQEPEAEIVLQSDPALHDRLSDAQRANLPDLFDQPREPRHALMEGELIALDNPPAARQLRRYKHATTIFEVTLGESIQTSATVMEELERRLPVTLMISLVAFPLIYIIAMPCGMLMAIKRGKQFDAAANITLLGAWSVPQVLSATLFIGFLAVGGEWIELFPSNGLSSVGSEYWPFSEWLADRVWHLILPVTCIVYGGVAYLAKQMRAAMLDNFTMDYVRTAKAKGVTSKDIIFRHVLRNSLLPIITIFATILPVLIAGSIIIETIFNIEGMGQLAFRAVQSRDYDVVQSLALIAGILNLSGLLIADVCYAIADPRITYN